MPRLPSRKICSRCGFSKEESESLCQRCRNGQEPYLTYVGTSSRCAKCGGVKNDVEQICEYCRTVQVNRTFTTDGTTRTSNVTMLSSTSGLQKDDGLVIDGIECEEIRYAEV